jgi:putative ABC transport system permease protein
MLALRQDMLHGFQMLLKKPGFTAAAALSLALGIGANTVIFSLINGTLLRPLAFPDPDRLMVVWTSPLDHPDQRNNVNVSTFFAVRDRNTSFESVGVFQGETTNIGAERDGLPAERLTGQAFTPSMFKILRAKPQLGRFFTDEEDQINNAAPVVLISHRYWQSHFSSDPNVIGKTLIMDTKPNTIIGVMPAGFDFFGDDSDYWIPQPISPLQVQSKQGFLVPIARLKPGVSMKQAQAEMTGIAAQLASGDPERNKGNGAQVQSLQEAAYGGLKSPLLLLQGAVGFVLLIGCANVAGLMLARAASRRTEMAVRTALGAGRARIVRQLIIESLPLSVLGGILGILLAWGGLKLFLAYAPPGFLRTLDISIDASVLVFTALIAVFTAVLFGIVPALQVSKPDLVGTLKESGRGGTDGAVRQRIRGALVALQIALALVLLIGAGLMVNSFLRVQNKDLGADPKGLLTFEFRFPQSDAIKPYSRYRGFGLWDVSPVTGLTYDRIAERMRGVPGVLSAAGSSRPPLNGGGIQMPFLIAGRPAPTPSTSPSGASQEPAQSANYFAITSDFFATLKIPILRGRDFTPQDTEAAPPVVIVNQNFVRRYFPNDNPIGQRITFDFVPEEKTREIVAVVGDTVVDRFAKEQTPIVYVPHRQQAARWLGPYWNDRAAMIFVLRTSGDPLSLIPAVRRAAAEIDPNKPAGELRTVEQSLDRQVQYLRLYILLLGIFGVIAAVLAAIGIYGVMAYSVAERTREIGVRMALGAGAREVFGLVVRQALLLIGIGLVIGLAGSLALTRLIQSSLYGVKATDPATYAGVSLLLVAVAMVACFIPTRRAVRVDPIVALRYE